MHTKETSQFRKLLSGDKTDFLMEAHDGLSAKIVKEAGFNGIWASGLCISASLGVRDNNEASWTQVLDVVEFMTDAASIPILLDADTGYGNFNNVRRLVRKLEQRRVAAMCIEDKLFPKTNSFINGEQQPLADVEEFVGKIKAAKDTQQDQDFSVVARIEAFIAGWGLDEAIRRAEAYHAAGADAILIHSKLPTADQVLSFMAEWGDRCPVIAVPTTYYTTPTQVLEDAGVRLIIWANHLLRSSVTAMQSATAAINKSRSIATLENSIASVGEVFRLQEAGELKEAERRYLPVQGNSLKAVVMAARTMGVSHGRQYGGNGAEHGPRLTMTKCRGRSLLHWQIARCKAAGIRDIVVLASPLPDDVDGSAVRVPSVPVGEQMPSLSSLLAAVDSHEGSLLVSSAELLFQQHTLTELLREPGDIVLLVDAADEREVSPFRFDCLVRCTQGSSRNYTDERPSLVGFSPEEPHGEWIGVAKLGPNGIALVRTAVHQLQKRPDFDQLEFRDLLAFLADTGEQIDVVYIHGQWLPGAVTVAPIESEPIHATHLH